MSMEVGSEECIRGRLVSFNAVFVLNIYFCSQVHQEDNHDRRQNNGSTPGIISPVTRTANAGIRTNAAVCGIQQMDESCRHDNPSTKIPSEEVDAVRNLPSWVSFGDNREEGKGSGNKENHKNGGNARSEVAIVVIFREGQIAKDIFLAGRAEVHVGSVEGRHEDERMGGWCLVAV